MDAANEKTMLKYFYLLADTQKNNMFINVGIPKAPNVVAKRILIAGRNEREDISSYLC